MSAVQEFDGGVELTGVCCRLDDHVEHDDANGEEIDALEGRLEMANIAAVPVIVILFGIAVALWRRRVLRRARAGFRP